ncbi:MAG: tetratricopeptide repeat protein, partial [Kofleriaceae bacterium]|nr:tetratricopeptide repeat protein [Kofleriaceae bacterium]
AVEIRAVAHEDVVAPRLAEVIAHGADYARSADADRDVVELRDGELAIDARDREPVTIVAGDTRVVIARSSAKVVARGGVIVTAQVFAGTAEVTERGRRQVVEEGEVWMPSKPPAPPVAATGFDAFRAGWQALREARHTDAIEAFDRATDPAVAEDAAFWAAIACERAGRADDAATRLRAFVDRFPASPRLDAARAALQRVAR